jgi:hypothetical protein
VVRVVRQSMPKSHLSRSRIHERTVSTVSVSFEVSGQKFQATFSQVGEGGKIRSKGDCE